MIFYYNRITRLSYNYILGFRFLNFFWSYLNPIWVCISENGCYFDSTLVCEGCPSRQFKDDNTIVPVKKDLK